MAITCHHCGREYDSKIFAFGRVVLCGCGLPIGREGWPGIERLFDSDADAVEMQLAAERIVALILYSDLPDIDIEIEIAALRRRCAELFPERIHLFDWIYGSRFKRLRGQFPRKRAG